MTTYTTTYIGREGLAMLIEAAPSTVGVVWYRQMLPGRYTVEPVGDTDTYVIRQAWGRFARISKNAHDLRDALAHEYRRQIVGGAASRITDESLF